MAQRNHLHVVFTHQLHQAIGESNESIKGSFEDRLHSFENRLHCLEGRLRHDPNLLDHVLAHPTSHTTLAVTGIVGSVIQNPELDNGRLINSIGRLINEEDRRVRPLDIILIVSVLALALWVWTLTSSNFDDPTSSSSGMHLVTDTMMKDNGEM